VQILKGGDYTMEKLKERLDTKVENEYKKFIERVEKLEPKKIIERAYEITTKEEIVILIQNKELGSTDIKALLKTNDLLGECYVQWLKTDGNFNELIDYAVDDRIDKITQDFIAQMKQRNKKRECR